MSSVTLPARILNRSSRQWVFGSPQTPFLVPPGVPTARIVDVPERFHARGKDTSKHEADDARDEKFRQIFADHLADPNSGLEALGDGAKGDPAVAKASADEITALRDQNAKLQRIVAAGDSAEEVEKAQADAKALFDANKHLIAERDALQTSLDSKGKELESAGHRIADLEGQLKSALSPKKK